MRTNFAGFKILSFVAALLALGPAAYGQIQAPRGLELIGVVYSCMNDVTAVRDMVTTDHAQTSPTPHQVFENRTSRAIWSVGITQSEHSANEFYSPANMVSHDRLRWSYSNPSVIDRDLQTERWSFYSLGLKSSENIIKSISEIPRGDFIYYCVGEVAKNPHTESGVSALLYCYGNPRSPNSNSVVTQILNMLTDETSPVYPVRNLSQRVQQYWMSRIIRPNDPRLSDPWNRLNCGQELIASIF